MHIFLTGIFLFLSTTTLVFGLYNGNPDFPMMPEDGLFISEDLWLGIKGGYEWDDCYNHYLELKDPPLGLSSPIEKYAMMGNFGVFTLNFRNRIEAYGTFGSAQARIDQKINESVDLAYKSDTCFAWSVGGRALLAYLGDFRLSLDAKYFEMHPSVNSLNVGRVSVPVEGMNLLYEEWQVGMSLCYCIEWFVPYIGIKHANVNGTLSGVLLPVEWVPQGISGNRLHLKGRYDVGVFTGLGVFSPKGFNFNMEWRFVDEFGVTISADIRF